MRVGGAKGLLALMSHEQALRYPGKDLVLRESMIKSVLCAESANDPSLLTLDVLRYGSLRIGTVLSAEAIIAMVHGGVSVRSFVDLANESLDELRDAFSPKPLKGETDEDVVKRVVASCYRRKGVGSERKKRECVTAGRSTKVAGVAFERSESEGTPECDETDLIDAVEKYAVDPITGKSGAIAEG